MSHLPLQLPYSAMEWLLPAIEVPFNSHWNENLLEMECQMTVNGVSLKFHSNVNWQPAMQCLFKANTQCGPWTVLFPCSQIPTINWKQIDYRWNGNEWSVTLLPLGCQLTGNWMLIDWTSNRMSIDYQSKANWLPIECHTTANWELLNCH